MRTTVTIDPDTEALVREEMKRSGRAFKEILNTAIRHSLQAPAREGKVHIKPLFAKPFPSQEEGLSFNRLADEWDDEETLKELRR